MRNSWASTGSQLSRIAWPPEAWNLPLTILAAFAGLIVAVAPAVVYFATISAAGGIAPADSAHVPPEQLLLAQLVTYPPLGIYLLFVVRALGHRTFAELGFRMPSARELGIGLLGALVMVLVVDLLTSALESLTHQHATETAIAILRAMHSPGQRALFALVAVVLAPLVEELAFRVFLFNAISRYASVAVAALGSGIVFGLAHAAGPNQFLTISVPLAVAGIVLAYVYAATRCYWANVCTHAIFNAVAVVAVFAFHAT
ncbi:MAG: lysostaphin resistance A-like protein [Vulcanimicrobiaceae bacterium]